MKIAIHNRQGSFSERWISYCKKNNISYKLVNCYDSDIIDQIADCDALMWHHHQQNYRDVLFAKQLLFSVEASGKSVFPDYNTGWHFDDKVGQKYLLESLKFPLIPSYIFYSKREALEWVNKTTFPKVFKLRGGAGSANVKLVENKKQARKLIKISFGKGFKAINPIDNLKERYRKVKTGKAPFYILINGIIRFFIIPEFAKMHPREKGYVYFQDFIANEGYDVRVVVINDKAISLKRLVRKKDFRASGSGNLVFENENIDIQYIKMAFNLAEKINTQSIAIDFIKDLSSKIYIVEFSYGFPMLNFIDLAKGYWDRNYNWHEKKINPQSWIIADLIRTIKKNESK